MHILVVGGAGYVGSVTVDQLINGGHDVTVLDNVVAGHRGALNPSAEFVQADVRGEEAVHRLVWAGRRGAPTPTGPPNGADQPLRRDEGGRRAYAPLVREAVRPALGLATLLQRGRCHRAPGRGPPPGDAPDPERAPGGAGAAARDIAVRR